MRVVAVVPVTSSVLALTIGDGASTSSVTPLVPRMVRSPINLEAPPLPGSTRFDLNDVRMIGRVEKVRAAQMPVALLVLRVYPVDVDRDVGVHGTNVLVVGGFQSLVWRSRGLGGVAGCAATYGSCSCTGVAFGLSRRLIASTKTEKPIAK